jgi:hypothetical protein
LSEKATLTVEPFSDESEWQAAFSGEDNRFSEIFSPLSTQPAAEHSGIETAWQQHKTKFEQQMGKERQWIATKCSAYLTNRDWKDEAGWFLTYLNEYTARLKQGTSAAFTALMRIGSTQHHAVKSEAPEWAQTLCHYLLAGEIIGVRRMIRQMCDGKDVNQGPDWMAPLFLKMVPCGDTPWNERETWHREDEGVTLRVLRSLTEKAILPAVDAVEQSVKEAWVEYAASVPVRASTPPQSSSTRENKQARDAAILKIWPRRKTGHINYKHICKQLDERRIPIYSGWDRVGQPSTWTAARSMDRSQLAIDQYIHRVIKPTKSRKQNTTSKRVLSMAATR